MSLLRRPGEKTYTQRCRLFVGNLPADITEDEFKRLFAKYGEPGEVFINKGKGFGFIKLVSFFFNVDLEGFFLVFLLLTTSNVQTNSNKLVFRTFLIFTKKTQLLCCE